MAFGEEPHLCALQETPGFRLDREKGMASLVRLFNHASRRLPRPLLIPPLEFSFPNNDTADAMICATDGVSNPKLVDRFSLKSISPETLARMALAQGLAATAFANGSSGRISDKHA